MMYVVMTMNSSLYMKSCRLSYAAYNSNTPKNNSKSYLKYYSKSNNVSPQALLCIENNYAYLAFRGSKNIHDLILATEANCNYLYGCNHHHNNIKCHSGYLKRYQGLHNDIIYDLCDFFNKNDNNNLVITGHSMGGALAKIACLYIASEFRSSKNLYVYTFGTPKIANQPFYDEVAYQTNDYIAFELDNDIIAKLNLAKNLDAVNQSTMQLESSTNIHDVLKNHSCFSYITALKKLKPEY